MKKLLGYIVVLYLAMSLFLIHKIYDVTEQTQNPESKLKSNEDYQKSAHIRSIANRSAENNRTLTAIGRIQLLTSFGPGENGTAVEIGGANLSLPRLLKRNEKHRFYTVISDIVNLRRRLPDMRPTACRKKTYPDSLPPVGVVIIYRDELPSILLRTVYSVLQMSPQKLIKEIILVDDGSKDLELRLTVTIHVAALKNVRVLRHENALGLMMARQSGVNAVTAEYFVILDGHMEVGPGWLEPLIYRLVQKPRSLLCSHVGEIDSQTFQYRIGSNKPDDLSFVEAFPFFDHMNLDQMFAHFSNEYKLQRNGSVEPILYGTIQGMMIVMKRDFFQELGGFDPGMKVWGSEQIELSVKVWMCGGQVEMVPCSTAAHMYRLTPWGGVDPKNDFHSLNKARMVQVWMDPPYSDVINHFLANKNFTTGDLSTRRYIRAKNKCKPYQYFIDQIRTFSDVYLPSNLRYWGRIINKATHKCLDVAKDEKHKYKIIQYDCYASLTANQYFIFTDAGHIRSTQASCLSIVQDGTTDTTIIIRERTQGWGGREMMWRYEDNMIINELTGTCLTAINPDMLTMKTCVTDVAEQKWAWDRVKIP